MLCIMLVSYWDKKKLNNVLQGLRFVSQYLIYITIFLEMPILFFVPFLCIFIVLYCICVFVLDL